MANEIEHLQSHIREMAGMLGKQQAEIARLRAALWDYGEHILTCRVRDGGECDCGFHDLLKTVEPPTVNEQTSVRAEK